MRPCMTPPFFFRELSIIIISSISATMTEASKHLAKVGTEKGEILFSNRNQSRKVHIIYILSIKNFVKLDF